MNIDYKLLEEQRNHLLSILWHDDKGEGVHGLLDEEIGWGIVNLLDFLLHLQCLRCILYRLIFYQDVFS